MTKDNNNDKNKMTEEELEILAEKIAMKVAAKLVDLTDISNYFKSSYTFKPFMEPYKPKEYEDPEIDQEEELIGELSRLMTMMNLYEAKEEYEKCAKIKKKIDAINRKLKNL
tara:strand:+ start:216 stop:551 length:336 start_codon:yes stop_codon:yes gene_type:complete